MGPKSEAKKEARSQKHNQPGKGAKAFAVARKAAPLTSGTGTGLRTVAAVTASAPSLVMSFVQPVIKTIQTPDGKVRSVRKWCLDQTPVYFTPAELNPSMHLYRGAVVEMTGQTQAVFNITETAWSQIVFRKYDARTGIQWYCGWVNDGCLEEYNEKYPDAVVPIPNPTPDPSDAQQYMMLEGITRFNLCGEFCVAFVIGADIDSMLATWKKNSPASYNSILAGGRDNKTGEYDLKNMLGAVLGEYGFGSDADQVISFKDRLTIPVGGPETILEDLKRMLPTHNLIVGLVINGAGELVDKNNPRVEQIKHWVVLDKITRNGNRVEIYNSFPNKREEYSFTQFYSSISSSWSGVWVKRKQPLAEEPAEELPVFEVPIAHPNPAYAARQYINVENRKLTNLCGEFSVAFIVKDSIDNMLARWKEVQPWLYSDIILNNRGTDIQNLVTILRAYGYNTPGDLTGFVQVSSPRRLAQMLETHLWLAGVGIETSNGGRLKCDGRVRHWVVVDKFTPERKYGGWIELYNPFMNRWEEYSFKEFKESAGTFSGLWVKRNIDPVFVPQVIIRQNFYEQPRETGEPGRIPADELRILILHKIQGLKPNKVPTKIINDLVNRSGWNKRDVINKVNEMFEGSKFGRRSEAEFIEDMQKRLKAGGPLKKVASDLADRQTGLKKDEIISLYKKAVKAGKVQPWTEAELRTVIEDNLKIVKSADKLLNDLAEVSHWRKPELKKLLKTMVGVEPAKLKGAAKKPTLLTAAEPAWKFSANPQTVIHASLPLAEYVQWQNSLLSIPGSRLYRVRKWGEQVMATEGAFTLTIPKAAPSNFQAVKVWSPEGGWGGVTNYLKIPHADVRKLAAMQLEDVFDEKELGHNSILDMEKWLVQKMAWLCDEDGRIYMRAQAWKNLAEIRWGTIVLGGNLVTVEGTIEVRTKLPNKASVEKVKMARLKGFGKFDWKRPLDDLLAEGLVHRCFCAYANDVPGDTPKGVVYSPFYSPRDWDFCGKAQPKAFYIPWSWLEPKVA